MKTKWQILKLGELANIKIGPFGSALKIGELKEQGPVRVLYIENIVGNSFNPTKEKFITEDKYKELKQYTVEPNDIVVTIMGTIGRTALVPTGIGKTIISSHLIKITTDQTKLLPAYLNYTFQDSFVSSQIMNQSKGAIMKGLNSTILKNLQIPLPDIEEQRRIVERLDAVLKTQELNNELTLKIQELFGSSLNVDFGSRNNTLTLGEVCTKITDGSHYTPKLQSSGYPFVTISNIVNGDIDLSTVEKFITEKDYYDLVKNDCKPLKGAILFSKDGTVGKVVEVKQEKDYVILSSLAILRPSEKILQSYLAYFLKSSGAISQATSRKTGAVIRRIVLKDLKQVKIPLLSLDAQKKIVEKLDAIQNYKSLLMKQKVLLDELFSSTLHKSLSGELDMVPYTQEVKASNTNFAIQQAIGALLSKGFKRGEMAITKVLYLLQEVYDLPIGIQFTRQNFGPYDAAVKKALTSGLSPRNKFFIKSGSQQKPYYELQPSGQKILKYKLAQDTDKTLNELLPKLSNAQSTDIERLASVCKLMQDYKTTDKAVIKAKMEEWKPNKFTDQEVERSINFITKEGWDNKLV